MSSEPSEALDVLRDVWSARGQDSSSIEEDCGTGTGGGCKRFSDVGFDGMAGPDGDLRAAWKAKLEREGKLAAPGSTVRDLVLGHAEAR